MSDEQGRVLTRGHERPRTRSGSGISLQGGVDIFGCATWG